jgi:DNA adenine methylase
MKYMGSKARLVKSIMPIMLKDRKPGQYYIEPFGGGANSICEVDNPRIYSDVNDLLAECLSEVSKGWIPPVDISRDFYSECRDKFKTGLYSDEEMHLIGYVGINGSYGGRWFDGGYAGITTTRDGKERNYPKEAWRNVISQAPKLEGVEFQSGCYKDLVIPTNSIIYCDPPYAGTKEYQVAKKSGFDYEEFWQWCREKAKEGHQVFISEYNAPEDFVCVWQQEVKSSLSANGKSGGNKVSTEKLFIHESQLNE